MTLLPNTKKLAALAGGLLLAGLPLLAQDGAEKVLVLRGATVHPVSGPPIPNGTVVVRGSQIEAVGAGLDIPAGAEQIDLSGKHLYPGFVHAGTQLGLVEIESVRGTEDTTDIGNFNPDHRAEVAFHAALLLQHPADLADVVLRQILDPDVGADAGRR